MSKKRQTTNAQEGWQTAEIEQLVNQATKTFERAMNEVDEAMAFISRKEYDYSQHMSVPKPFEEGLEKSVQRVDKQLDKYQKITANQAETIVKFYADVDRVLQDFVSHHALKNAFSMNAMGMVSNEERPGLEKFLMQDKIDIDNLDNFYTELKDEIVQNLVGKLNAEEREKLISIVIEQVPNGGIVTDIVAELHQSLMNPEIRDALQKSLENEQILRSEAMSSMREETKKFIEGDDKYSPFNEPKVGGSADKLIEQCVTPIDLVVSSHAVLGKKEILAVLSRYEGIFNNIQSSLDTRRQSHTEKGGDEAMIEFFQSKLNKSPEEAQEWVTYKNECNRLTREYCRDMSGEVIGNVIARIPGDELDDCLERCSNIVPEHESAGESTVFLKKVITAIQDRIDFIEQNRPILH